MADQVNPIVAMLANVLEPLGEEKRDQILQWVEHEIDTRPIVAYCADDQFSWDIGGPDPLAPEGQPRTIFAMLEVDNTIVVFSFAEIPVPGGNAIQFFRDVVYEPKRSAGPLNHEALFRELQTYLTGVDPDGPPLEAARPRPNGARA